MRNFYADGTALLKSYNFPGNIRELENIIERAFILSDEEYITIKDIDIKLNNKSNLHKISKIKNIEKDEIIKALQKWEGNRTKATGELGISRRTIINKINEYGLDV